MTLPGDRAAFVKAHEKLATGDFGGFLNFLHDVITYIVNVDGMQVPYAMSGLGKADVQDRLQLVMETFVVSKFDVENIIHEEECSRSLVHVVYHHKKTGEILDFKLRFRAWIENGLITRMEEILDAPFIEAYERFVFHMQSAAESRGPP
jgi:ketosteroid isomerase-like protein